MLKLRIWFLPVYVVVLMVGTLYFLYSSRVREDQRQAAEAHREKAIEYRSTGQFDQAVLEFQKALILRTDDDRTRIVLATTLVKAERYQEAVAEFEKAGVTTVLPSSEAEFLRGEGPPAAPSEYVAYGRALSKTGKAEQARQVWQKVARLDWDQVGSSEAKKMLQTP
jgi:tetratricopeptide (TPR) repeat protein